MDSLLETSTDSCQRTDCQSAFEKTENPAAVAGLIRALREVIAELEAEASFLQSTAAGTRLKRL